MDDRSSQWELPLSWVAPEQPSLGIHSQIGNRFHKTVPDRAIQYLLNGNHIDYRAPFSLFSLKSVAR